MSQKIALSSELNRIALEMIASMDVDAGLREMWDKVKDMIKKPLTDLMAHFGLSIETLPKTKEQALKIIGDYLKLEPGARTAVDKKIVIGAVIFLIISGALGVLWAGGHNPVQVLHMIASGHIDQVVRELATDLMNNASNLYKQFFPEGLPKLPPGSMKMPKVSPGMILPRK